MSFVFKIKPAGFTADKYRETLKQLEAEEAAARMGIRYHVGYRNADRIDK